MRVDGGTAGLTEPKVFLSDRRAAMGKGVSSLLWEEEDDEPDEDEEESVRPGAEPVGDAALLTDLGTTADQLLELCAEEGLLPGDVMTELCERAGCGDVLEGLREG